MSNLLHHLRALLRPSTAAGATDGQLLDRFLTERDEEAFAALVQRHGPSVFGVCRRLQNNAQDAEDAFQATFLALVRQAGSIRNQASLGSWLYGVAYRTALKARARAARRRTEPAPLENLMAPEQPDDMTWQELRPILDEELYRLPEKYRGPLILCYLEGRSYTEAARELGCSAGTLSGRLARARDRLRGRLERRGLVLSAVLIVPLLAAKAPAAVPIPCAEETVRAAALYAAGRAAGGVSAQVLALIEGTWHGLPFSRLTIAGVLLTLGLAGGVAGWMGWRSEGSTEERVTVADDPPRVVRDPAAPAPPGQDEPLPAGAFARLGNWRWRQPGGAITHVRLNGDAKAIDSQGGDGVLRRYDAQTGKELKQLLRLHPYAYRSWSADGKLLATSVHNSDVVEFHDLATGRELPKIDHKDHGLLALALAPAGDVLALVQYDARLCLFEVASGKLLRRVREPIEEFGNGNRAFVCVAPDSKTVALALSDNKGLAVEIWDLASGQRRQHFKPRQGSLSGLCFSPDGKMLALLGDERDPERWATALRSVELWDAASGRPLHFCDGVRGRITALAFAPDGRSFVTSADDLHFWDTASGKRLRSVTTRVGCASLAYSADGKLVAGGGSDGILRLWDAASGADRRPEETMAPVIDRSTSSPDGRLLATADETALRLWDTETGKLWKVLAGEPGSVHWMWFAPDGRALFVMNTQQTRCWEVSSGKEVALAPDLKDGWRCPAHAVTGRFIAVRRPPSVPAFDKPLPDNPVIVVDRQTGKEVGRVRPTAPSDPHQARVWDFQFHMLTPDGQRLLTVAINHAVQTWGVASGKELTCHGAWARGGSSPSVAVSSDGSLVAVPGNEDADLRLYDAASGRLVRSIEGHRGEHQGHSFMTAAFSPDSRYVALSSPKSAVLWLYEVATGGEVSQWRGTGAQFYRMTFAPDGRILAVCGQEGALHLIDVTTGKEVRTLRGHREAVWHGGFTADGRKVVTQSTDGTVVFWDLGRRSSQEAPAWSEKELGELYASLARPEAEPAAAAIAALAEAPAASVPFLQARLEPVSVASAGRLRDWLTDLESDSAEKRTTAAAQLLDLDHLAERALRRLLAEGRPTLDLRLRAERILGQLERHELSAGQLRTLRAVTVLERIGSDEARRVLDTLAKGAPEVRRTQDARAALERLDGRSGKRK